MSYDIIDLESRSPPSISISDLIADIKSSQIEFQEKAINYFVIDGNSSAEYGINLLISCGIGWFSMADESKEFRLTLFSLTKLGISLISRINYLEGNKSQKIVNVINTLIKITIQEQPSQKDCTDTNSLSYINYIISCMNNIKQPANFHHKVSIPIVCNFVETYHSDLKLMLGLPSLWNMIKYLCNDGFSAEQAISLLYMIGIFLLESFAFEGLKTVDSRIEIYRIIYSSFFFLCDVNEKYQCLDVHSIVLHPFVLCEILNVSQKSRILKSITIKYCELLLKHNPDIFIETFELIHSKTHPNFSWLETQISKPQHLVINLIQFIWENESLFNYLTPQFVFFFIDTLPYQYNLLDSCKLYDKYLQNLVLYLAKNSAVQSCLAQIEPFIFKKIFVPHPLVSSFAIDYWALISRMSSRSLQQRYCETVLHFIRDCEKRFIGLPEETLYTADHHFIVLNLSNVINIVIGSMDTSIQLILFQLLAFSTLKNFQSLEQMQYWIFMIPFEKLKVSFDAKYHQILTMSISRLVTEKGMNFQFCPLNIIIPLKVVLKLKKAFPKLLNDQIFVPLVHWIHERIDSSEKIHGLLLECFIDILTSISTFSWSKMPWKLVTIAFKTTKIGKIILADLICETVHKLTDREKKNSNFDQSALDALKIILKDSGNEEKVAIFTSLLKTSQLLDFKSLFPEYDGINQAINVDSDFLESDNAQVLEKYFNVLQKRLQITKNVSTNIAKFKWILRSLSRTQNDLDKIKLLNQAYESISAFENTLK